MSPFGALCGQLEKRESVKLLCRSPKEECYIKGQKFFFFFFWKSEYMIRIDLSNLAGIK